MLIQLDRVHGLDWAVKAAKLSYNMEREVKPEEMFGVSTSDIELARKLAKAGPSHSKFLRAVIVWATIRAPRYFFAQFSTYKVGTVELSQSTMHTLMKRGIAPEDFEGPIPLSWIDHLNSLRGEGQFTDLKALLPEGYLQTRGVCMNYQVLRTMYHQRKSHRLKEWHEFCEWVETLPSSELILA